MWLLSTSLPDDDMVSKTLYNWLPQNPDNISCSKSFGLENENVTLYATLQDLMAIALAAYKNF